MLEDANDKHLIIPVQVKTTHCQNFGQPVAKTPSFINLYLNSKDFQFKKQKYL